MINSNDYNNAHFPDYSSIKAPQTWDLLWQNTQEQCFCRQKSLDETIEFWNKRADGFKKSVMESEHGEIRVNETLQWLEKEGVVLKNASVLDIGAGPGPFTFPIAEQAREVVALEPAEAMVDYLQSAMEQRNFNNINILCQPWETVDIEKNNLKERFDLVFASMTPGIRNAESLHKAIECANKYFYIGAFAGKRHNPALYDLWMHLTGEEMPPWPDHIFFIYNILHHQGYDISLQIFEEERVEKQPLEKAVNYLQLSIQSYLEDTSNLEEKITNFLEKRSSEGILEQTITTRLGRLLIKK